MWRILSFTMALALLAVAPAHAQVTGGHLSVGVSIGTISFEGATETTEARSDKLRAIPFRPTMWRVTIAYGGSGARVGFGAAYGQPGLALRGNPAATPDAAGNALLIVADNAFKLATLTATVSAPVKRFSAGPSLRPSLGLLLERWSSPGAPTRTIVGGQAGLHLEIPLSGSFAGMAGAELGFTPGSPFEDDVVPDGFKTRSTWRRTLSGGVVIRL